MATLQLDYDLEYDFLVVGVSSNQRAYTLCWEINNILETELILFKPLEFKTKKGIQSFKLYESTQADFVLSLIGNKNGNHRFVPEYPTIDFFIKFYEMDSPYTCSELISHLRKSKFVQAVFNIDIEELKSKQSFLF